MPPSMYQGQVAGTRWDPNLYLKSSDHRLHPGLELLDRIPPASPSVVYDLGCGSRPITHLSAEHWPAAMMYGVDHSRDMLAKAATEPGRVQWVEADIHYWQPDNPHDLIYSNATLRWVEGHWALFPCLLRLLNPGRCLAVQMPLS